MELNYIVFAIISLIPVVMAYLWYSPKNVLLQKLGYTPKSWQQNPIKQIILLYILSCVIMAGFANLVIHQIGFYELFFTDIMKGSEEAQVIVDEFLSQYGQKHRHFGHGFFHGLINSVSFALPFVGIVTIIEQKSKSFFWAHFIYLSIVITLCCALISEFV